MKKTLFTVLIILISISSYAEQDFLSFKDFMNKINERYLRIEKTYVKAEKARKMGLADEGYNLGLDYSKNYASSESFNYGEYSSAKTFSNDTSLSISKHFNYGTDISLDYSYHHEKEINTSHNIMWDGWGYEEDREYTDRSFSKHLHFDISQSVNDIFLEKNRQKIITNTYNNSLIKSDDLRNSILYSSALDYIKYLEYIESLKSIKSINNYISNKLSRYSNLEFEKDISLEILREEIEKNKIYISKIESLIIESKYKLYSLLGESIDYKDYDFENILNKDLIKNNFDNLKTNTKESLIKNSIEKNKLEVKDLNLSQIPTASFGLSFDNFDQTENVFDFDFDDKSKTYFFSSSYTFFNKKYLKELVLKGLNNNLLERELKDLQTKNKNIISKYDKLLKKRELNLNNLIKYKEYYTKNSNLRFILLDSLLKENNSIESLYSESKNICKISSELLNTNLSLTAESAALNIEYLYILKDYNAIIETFNK